MLLDVSGVVEGAHAQVARRREDGRERVGVAGGVEAQLAAVTGRVTPGLQLRVFQVGPAEAHVKAVAVDQGLEHQGLPVVAGSPFQHERGDRVRRVRVDVGEAPIRLRCDDGVVRDEVACELQAYVRQQRVELRELFIARSEGG